MSTQIGSFQVAIEAIIEKDGKILVTKRATNRDQAPGAWETICGRLNQDESFEQGLLREVYEETKLTVKPLQIVDTFHIYHGPEKHDLNGVVYVCEYSDGEVILDTNEQVEYKWVTPEEAIEIVTIENIKKHIQSFIDWKSSHSAPFPHLNTYRSIDTFFRKTYPEMTDEVRTLARLTKITEELGELTNEVHATLGFHKASPHKQDDPSNLAKEWADVFNTVILMGVILNLDMNEVITKRLEDIKERYKLE